MHFLLRVYAQDKYIAEAVLFLRNLEQKPDELVIDYFHRFENAHTRAGGYMTEKKQMLAFLNGLDETTQERCRMHTRNRKKTSMIDVIEFAQAEDNSLRALCDRARSKKTTGASSSAATRNNRAINLIGAEGGTVSPTFVATLASSDAQPSVDYTQDWTETTEQQLMAAGRFS